MGEQVAAGLYGGIAQLGEHLPCKQGVKSSNLFISIADGNTCNSIFENCTVTKHIEFLKKKEDKR